MPKVLKLDKGAEEGLREFFRFLLESGKVKGVFTLARMGKQGPVGYALMTDPDALEEAVPLYPLMPANMGKQLARVTLEEAAGEPVAAMLRPCELRAFVELVKRSQGSPDNFLLISSTCGGVYPLKTATDDGYIEGKLPQYWGAVKKSENPSDLRPACASCEHFVPYTADMTLNLIGNKDLDTQCEISLNTRKAEEFAEAFQGGLQGQQESGAESAKALLDKRRAQKAKLLDELAPDGLNMATVFSQCIGCHGCSKACPICYCRLCFFETDAAEDLPPYDEMELAEIGRTRVPSDNVFYHLVRLFHVSVSCVGCGQCADVCPADIPVSLVSLKTSGAVQEAFDYLPGRDPEEEIPLAAAFRPEEFTESE